MSSIFEVGFDDLKTILKGLKGDYSCNKKAIEIVANKIIYIETKFLISTRIEEWVKKYILEKEIHKENLKHIFYNDMWTFEESVQKRIYDWTENLSFYWDDEKNAVVQSMGGFNSLLKEDDLKDLTNYLNEKVKEDRKNIIREIKETTWILPATNPNLENCVLGIGSEGTLEWEKIKE